MGEFQSKVMWEQLTFLTSLCKSGFYFSPLHQTNMTSSTAPTTTTAERRTGLEHEVPAKMELSF